MTDIIGKLTPCLVDGCGPHGVRLVGSLTVRDRQGEGICISEL